MEKVEAIAVIPAVLMAPMVIKRGLLKAEVREMSVVFVAVYSAFKLKESLPAPKIIGDVLIFGGIFLLFYFSA